MNINEIAAVVSDIRHDGFIFRVAHDLGAPYIQLLCHGNDARTNEPVLWSSRKWRLSLHMTRSEIVQTALKAVLTAVEHEARERFLYKGQPIFGPHHDVDALVELCETSSSDVRVDNRSAELVTEVGAT